MQGRHPGLESENIITNRQADISRESSLEAAHPARIPWKRVLISAGITIVLVGTFLFRFPQGLAGWLDIFPAYLKSWDSPQLIAAARLLAALIFFQPIAVLFGTIGIIHGFANSSNNRDRFLTVLCSTWFGFGLLLALLPGGRQVSDLAWVLIPIWMLAARELANYLPGSSPHPIGIGQALMTAILMGLMWFTLASTSRTGGAEFGSLARFAILVGIIALMGLMTLLVGMGWSWEVSKRGLVWGLVLGMGLYTTAALWSVGYVRPNQPQGLWGPVPATGETDLLLQTIHFLSSWNTGRENEIDIVSEIDTPAMRWLLRNFPKASYSSLPNMDGTDSLLITPQAQESPALASSYRGQSFVWKTYPGWPGVLPEDFIRWLNYREAPLFQENIILWVRSDLFPGGNLPVQFDLTPSLEEEVLP